MNVLYCHMAGKETFRSSKLMHIVLRNLGLHVTYPDSCICVLPLTQRQCSVMLYLHLHPSFRWSHWPAAGPSPPPCGLDVLQPAVQSYPGSLCPPTRGRNVIEGSLKVAMVCTPACPDAHWLPIIWAQTHCHTRGIIWIKYFVISD